MAGEDAMWKIEGSDLLEELTDPISVILPLRTAMAAASIISHGQTEGT